MKERILTIVAAILVAAATAGFTFYATMPSRLAAIEATLAAHTTTLNTILATLLEKN